MLGRPGLRVISAYLCVIEAKGGSLIQYVIENFTPIVSAQVIAGCEGTRRVEEMMDIKFGEEENDMGHKASEM